MNGEMKKQPDQEGTGPSPDEVTPAQYIQAAKTQLMKNKRREAYTVLQAAIAQYPDEPVILSYFGYLKALVDRKYRSGIESCTKAIASLKEDRSFIESVPYSVLYLNLGRAYLAAGKKRDAINAFQSGLKRGRNNDLLKELNALGTRKKTALPFLDRSNPINKLIGMALHKGK